MAKVVFCFFGNTLSSLITSEVLKQIIAEKYGIKKIGESGFPVAVCHHGIDVEIFPFLLESPSCFPSIETISSTFSHALVGILSDSEKKFQIKNGVEGDSGVFFFPDFVNPRPNIIKDKYFLYLGDQQEFLNPYDTKIKSDSEIHSAISFDNKIGIPIDGFRKFLNIWNKHAAVPSKENLGFLMREFEKICEDKKREFVIIPINLEQPYVGSVLGEKLWEIFFSELEKNKYKNYVVSLSSILDYCQKSAQKKRPPARITVKWSYYQNQKQLFSEMNEIVMPADPKKYYKASVVKCIAYSADYFASIGRRTAFPELNFPIIECADLKGKKYKIELKYNPELEAVCNAARLALKKNEKFLNVLQKLDNNFIVTSIGGLAKKLSL